VSQHITRLLQQASEGDRAAFDALMPLVYEPLRRIARGQIASDARGHTLSTTALVHEVWLRLSSAGEVGWQDQQHFYRYAARAMRNILIDAARARQAQKRGSGAEHLDIDDVALPISEATSGDLLALDEALLKLAEVNPRLAQVVELRFFAGLEVEQVGEVLGIHARSVVRDWRRARALLAQMLDAEALPG
jgi:RNA polymerase sigma factor (TIGR02999 family)